MCDGTTTSLKNGGQSHNSGNKITFYASVSNIYKHFSTRLQTLQTRFAFIEGKTNTCMAP